MPDQNTPTLTDEEVRHFAVPVQDAYAAGGAERVVRSLYDAGLLQFGDYGDREHLRRSWAAMSSCLITLSRHEEPDPHWLAQVPDSHHTYLLGHAAMHRQAAEMYRRLRAAEEALSALMDGRSEEDRDAIYRVVQVVRGEPVEVEVEA